MNLKNHSVNRVYKVVSCGVELFYVFRFDGIDGFDDFQHFFPFNIPIVVDIVHFKCPTYPFFQSFDGMPNYVGN